jgi:hypothetical protein
VPISVAIGLSRSVMGHTTPVMMALLSGLPVRDWVEDHD